MSKPEPRPLKPHKVSTVFLRVPSEDWPGVSSGRQREFHARSGNVPQIVLHDYPLPTLVVAYRKRRATRDWDYRLLTLEAIFEETLGTLDEEHLALAGYSGENARGRFRREWRIRNRQRFDPLRRIHVFRVRPATEDDVAETGAALVNHLYGSFFAEEAHTRTGSIRAFG